eukprot:10784668-Karenia_brevis.AAC.1
MEAGIQGISFSPVATQSQEQPAGVSTSLDAGGGGTKRDSSPTPQAQAPKTKEMKTDNQA